MGSEAEGGGAGSAATGPVAHGGRGGEGAAPVESVAPPAAVLDERGTVVGWTLAAERVLGYRAAEVVGRPASMLVAAKDPDRALAWWTRRARSGRSWSGTVALRAKDGTASSAVLEASPMARDGGRDWFVTGIDQFGAALWPPMDTSAAAALMARSPVGLSIWDTDLRCIWLNAAAAHQDGLLGRQRLGRLMTEVQPGRSGLNIVEAMRQVLRTGNPVIEREYTWQVPGEENERILSASYFRVDGADGRPIGVCNMATDIDKSLARQHLLTLGEMGSRIGTTLDVVQTAQELADAAVPLLADYVTVDLGETVPLGAEEAAGGEPPLNRLQASPEGMPIFRRAGAASSRRGMPESIWRIGEPVYVPSSSPFTRALYSGQTHFEPYLDTSPGTWLARDPRRARRITQLGMHSLVIVPLRARGNVLGEAVFVRHDNPLPFSRDDMLLLEELVHRAALSLDNARRYSRERTAALALQRNLMSSTLTGGAAVELAARYLPSGAHKGVGGDWFDAVLLPDARVGLVIGDVVGHGIHAAALMGQLRTVTATLADLDFPPEEVLARLDRSVGVMNDRNSTGDDAREGGDGPGPMMTCTCAYAVYDPVTRQCAIASAGHPPPAVVLPGGTVLFPEVPPGPPIGLGTMAYESVTLELPEGSVIALYTDGLIETREADLGAGLERLGAALARPATSLEEYSSHIIGAMTPRIWRQAGPLDAAGPIAGPLAADDDIALLLARTRVLTPDQAAAQRRP